MRSQLGFIGTIGCLLAVGCGGEGSISHPDSGLPHQTTGADAGFDVGHVSDAAAPAPDSSAALDSGEPRRDLGGAADAAEDDVGVVQEDAAMPQACDYQAVDDVVVIEAESLPLNEDWVVGTAAAGYTGAGYIDWTGASYNNDPTHGVMEVLVRITTPGRYRLQWHSRIGNGSNTTEHNDAWFRFPDAADYYGLKGQPGAEIRRYSKPQCDDAALMADVVARGDVDVADCARGSTVDGWLKVYSSGASDWRWATFTSDNDASQVMAEFDAPGVYTMQLAARADRCLIDRLVLHLESVDDATVRDLSVGETPCP